MRIAPLIPCSTQILAANGKPPFPIYRPIADKHWRLGLAVVGIIQLGTVTTVINFITLSLNPESPFGAFED